MDKILSAEEWLKDNGSFYEDNICMLKDYSNYLLEEFASDLIDASNVSYVNESRIDQLLTKFKEKL